MYNQTMFAIAAAILLMAIASSSIYTLKAASAQSNMTNVSGSAKYMTNPTIPIHGCIGAIKNMNVHSNLPRCAIQIGK
jgi:hypothetical protein